MSVDATLAKPGAAVMEVHEPMPVAQPVKALFPDAIPLMMLLGDHQNRSGAPDGRVAALLKVIDPQSWKLRAEPDGYESTMLPKLPPVPSSVATDRVSWSRSTAHTYLTR